MNTTRPLRQELPVVLIAGLGGLFTPVDASAAQPWADLGAGGPYGDIRACSADGATLLAASPVSYTGRYPIGVSTNSGATWIQTPSPTNRWSSVTWSADGTRMAAVAPSSWDMFPILLGGTRYPSRESRGSASGRTAGKAPTVSRLGQRVASIMIPSHLYCRSQRLERVAALLHPQDADDVQSTPRE